MTSRYEKFDITFDFEISRVDCICVYVCVTYWVNVSVLGIYVRDDQERD